MLGAEWGECRRVGSLVPQCFPASGQKGGVCCGGMGANLSRTRNSAVPGESEVIFYNIINSSTLQYKQILIFINNTIPITHLF